MFMALALPSPLQLPQRHRGRDVSFLDRRSASCGCTGLTMMSASYGSQRSDKSSRWSLALFELKHDRVDCEELRSTACRSNLHRRGPLRDRAEKAKSSMRCNPSHPPTWCIPETELKIPKMLSSHKTTATTTTTLRMVLMELAIGI